MKLNIWKIAIVALGAALVFTGCKKDEKDNDSVSVSISAVSSAFDNGKATLLLKLSGKTDSDVKVTLSESGTLPDAKLSYDKSVTIPAGESFKEVAVSANAEGLEAGEYTATFTIASASGATVGTPKEASVTLAVNTVAKVEVNIDADGSFTDNKATLAVSLKKAVTADVTVTLKAGEDVASGCIAIPADALSFTNPVTVAAGSKNVDVEVSVDPSKLTPGEKYQANIVIDAVSDNAKIGTDDAVVISYEMPVTAKLREDWTVSFAGEYEKDGTVYHDIEVSGTAEEEGYYLFIYQKGTVASNFESVSEYLQYLESNVIGPSIGTEDAYQIKTGNTGWLYYKLSVGDYEIWMVGCSASGHVTGDYTTNEFSIEPSEEMKAVYDKYLGEWQLDSPRMPWTISEKVYGASYTITGIEGMDWPVEAILNDDLQLEIHAQADVVDSYEVTYQGSTYDCTVGLFGIDNSEGYFWTGTYVIAYGDFDEDGNITLTPGTVSSSSGEYTLGTMIFIAQDKGGQGAFSISNNSCGLPNMLIDPNNIEVDDTPVVTATYDSFIGTWSFGGGWGIEIAPSETENTYVFSIGEGYEAVAKFEDGKLALYDQVFGSFTHDTYGACSFMIGGVFAYGGSEYIYYISNNGQDVTKITRIFTGELHESGNITLTPGSCEYGDYVAFRYRWFITEEGENQYKGNYLTDPIYLSDIVKPYEEEEEPASVAKPFKVESRIRALRSKSARVTAESLSELVR